MPKSQLIAKIKRMDVTNKVKRNHWKQVIGITLGEIALNDENLLAIRKFRPNEEVMVTILPLQQSMAKEMNRIKEDHPVEGIISDSELPGIPDNPLDLLILEEEEGEETEELVEITLLKEGDEDPLEEGEEVAKNFEF